MPRLRLMKRGPKRNHLIKPVVEIVPRCYKCGKVATRSVYTGAERGYRPACDKCSGLGRREKELHIGEYTGPVDYAKFSSGDW